MLRAPPARLDTPATRTPSPGLLMPSLYRSILLATLTAGSLVGFAEARDSITAREIRAHLFLLASDQIQGPRAETGSGIQAEYVASSFIGMGLLPVGDTYFHDVPLTGVTVDPITAVLAAEVGGDRLTARVPSDAVVAAGMASSRVQVSGEVVFVGYGIDADGWKWDDYKERDLEGKILLFLVGEPPAPPDEPDLFEARAMTYYGHWSYKLEEARRRGASGALLIHRPESSADEWDAVASSWALEQFVLEDDTGQRPPLQGWVTADFARRALTAARLDLDELVVRAARRDFSPVATGIKVWSRVNSRSRTVRPQNVVGFIPGRTDEVVILTARYGVSAGGSAPGAVGMSMLLEIAQAFSQMEPSERGILFMAMPGEGTGLLASREYLRNPLFALPRTAAAIHLDGAGPGSEPGTLSAPGSAYTSLGDVLKSRAEEAELTVVPAGSGSYANVAHHAFGRAGIPTLHLGTGGSHPRDELSDADLEAAADQARMVFGVVYDVANAEGVPVWRRTLAPTHH